MSNWRVLQFTSIVVSTGLLLGCLAGEKTLHYVGDADLEHYRDAAVTVDYADVAQESPDAVIFAHEPRRLRNRKKEEIWNLTLEEALRLAMANSEIIRDNGQFLSPSNRLLTSPNFARTIYDVPIQEAGTLFGQRGVEAALAEFDAQLSTSMTWGRSEQVSEGPNIGFVGGEAFVEEFGDFQSSLQKQFADGGLFALSHNWLYSGRNSQFNGGRLFPSHFTSRPGTSQQPGLPTVGLTYRRPLWAGAGTDFTRIAGPVNRRPTLQNTTPVNQGVVIARIRTDISLADFESSVQNLIKDVEDLYWQLYLAYRTFNSEIVSRNSALQTWREVKAKAEIGAMGGGAADEAQARDNYFEIRARAENALSNIYSSEARLRRLLALPVNDGRIIRPTDDPITAEFVPDWQIKLVEALTNRVELRRQKWNIKSLELQLQAAKSLTHPRFDFVSRYQINGFGDGLDGPQDQPFHNAYRVLTSGDYTGWGLGFEFNMPLGFRAALAQVRNVELRLAKARSILAQQELEISHELANAFQVVDQTYTTAQTNFNRRRAAERRVQAFAAEYEAGRATLDLLLRAQISQAQAEVAYYSSLVAYNQGLNDLRYRSGTILSDNNIHLAEGLSTPRAYIQALRKAWDRSHAIDATHLRTEPSEFVNCQPGVDCYPPAATGIPATNQGYDTMPPNPAPPSPAPPEGAPPVPTLDPKSANSTSTPTYDAQPPFVKATTDANPISGDDSPAQDSIGRILPPANAVTPRINGSPVPRTAARPAPIEFKSEASTPINGRRPLPLEDSAPADSAPRLPSDFGGAGSSPSVDNEPVRR